MKSLKHTVSLLFVILVAFKASGSLALQPDAEFKKIAQTFAYELPRQHLSRHELNDSTSKLMLENYIALLDPERIYFLDSDIKHFNRKENLLDDEIRVGDTKFAYELLEVLKERVRDRNTYVTKTLEKGFDLTVDEDYHWERKNAAWAVDNSEWNDLWRKRIKNEYIRRIIAEEINSPTNYLCAVSAEENTDTPITASNIVNKIYHTIEATEEFFEIFEKEAEVLPEENLTTEEYIQKRYTQFLGILEDSDNKWVLQKYLSAFARSYDPHCDYMSPETAENFDIDMKLSLVGIGAMLQPEDGTAKIMSLIPGGPAASDKSKNRLRPGDKIIGVAQGNEKSVSILHWPLSKAVRIIRGDKGSRVVLTVIPAIDPSGLSTKKVVLIRDEVKLEAREAKSEIKTITDADGNNYKLGVIKLPGFYADMQGKRTNPDYKSSSRDVSKILREMRSDNIDGLILDLRNNGGGSLVESVLMTGLFIKTGPTVQVREQRNISILPDNNPSIIYSGPMIVLVNRLSASASEILAAALQDYGRAIIVGDSKTHGKGSVQTVLNLNRNSKMGKMKVTNALFYRISGGSTQLRGVTPDIVIPSAFEYLEYGEDTLPNPMEWSNIRTAIYSPFGNLDEIIPELTLLSEKRRETEEQFIAYSELLKRIKTMNSEKILSLNIDTRRTRAKTEKDLLDIQNELMEQSNENDDSKEANDIIKNETLKILVDLINATAKQEKALAIAGIPTTSKTQ